MNRRLFLSGSLLALAAPTAAVSQEPVGKIWRIGTVFLGSPETMDPLLKVIEESLGAAGYVHGRNILLRQQIGRPNPADVERTLREVVPTIDLLIVGGTLGGGLLRRR